MAVRDRVKIFFDGGCRPVPYGMETAVVVKGRAYIQRDIGAGTSMDAEWLALLHAVKIAGEFGLEDPVFLGDALAVIGQANGTVRCRDEYAHHRRALFERATHPRIRYVKRTQNLAGIALAHVDRRRIGPSSR